MKDKKLYCYTKTVFLGSILAFVLIAMLIPLILYPKQVWFLIFPIFIVLLSGWYMVGTGMFNPIYINDSRVKYRGREYSWDEIRITAFNRQYKVCYLVFGDEYLGGKDLKKQMRNGFWVFLKKKPLMEILKYYNHSIKIVDVDGLKEDSEICSTKKIKSIINEHNSKFSS